MSFFMLAQNIKDVRFSFSAGPEVEKAMEDAGGYMPSEVADHLKLKYSLDLPATRDRDIVLCLDFHCAARDAITFTALDCDAQSPLLAFGLSVHSVLGRKDWQYYIDNKISEDTLVCNPDKDSVIINFHDILGKRLQAVLQAKGLKHIYADTKEDIIDVYAEKQILGVVLEHRYMHVKNGALGRGPGL